VRLLRGELSAKTDYGTPLDIAHEFIQVFSKMRLVYPELTPWVHLVDLNAAFGDGNNVEVLDDVTSLLSEYGISVERSGGIRDDNSLEHAIQSGAARVNVGTAALENPEWTRQMIEKHREVLAIGLDVRGETLAARGWTKDGGNIWESMDKLFSYGASRFVITDVTKDGTLSGVNVDLLARSVEFVQKCDADVKITASGGVSKLEDIAQLKHLVAEFGGVLDSVIFGKAMYSGAFSLEEAIEVAQIERM
jgi:phosphoribosylformimino-5-aminoimidazole carboxamide ribotide isomerase/phosphoribosylanthranilate isomerase